MQIGELPQRPSGVDDVVWEFLQKCWSRDPTKRPPTAQVCDAFSQFCSLPRFALGKSALPGDLMLQVQSIKISLDKSKQPRFFVKLKYGNKGHTTPLAKPVDGSGEHTWFVPRPFLLSLPPLNLTQERSGKMGFQNQEKPSRTIGFHRTVSPGIWTVQERQGLRDGEFPCKSRTSVQPLTWLIVRPSCPASQQ